MCHVLIIADDLTGSLDAAVGFVRAGRRVLAARGFGDVAECIRHGADVISVTTNSRNGSAEAAIAAVEASARAFDPHKAPIVMKKVDSRLKGHPGDEGRALARLSGRDVIVAAPAMPRMARVQSAGWLTGTGIEGALRMSERLGRGMIFPDVTNQGDLDAIVADREARRSTLWLGASDLAFALARAEFGGAPADPPRIVGPLVVVIGSRDPITVAQVDRLSRDGVPVHRAPNGDVGAVVMTDGPAVIAIAEGEEPCPEDEAGARFAEGAARILRSVTPAALLCSGGETANAVLSQLGVGCMEVIGEIAPGLPCCRIAAPWGEVRLITKSGGFGEPGLLSELALGAGFAENSWPNQDLQ